MFDYISLGKASYEDKPQINGAGIYHSSHRETTNHKAKDVDGQSF